MIIEAAAIWMAVFAAATLGFLVSPPETRAQGFFGGAMLTLCLLVPAWALLFGGG